MKSWAAVEVWNDGRDLELWLLRFGIDSFGGLVFAFGDIMNIYWVCIATESKIDTGNELV